MICSIDDVIRIVLLVVAPLRSTGLLGDSGRRCLKPVEVIPSGSDLLERMQAGLPLLGDCTHVLVHEASRPFASRDLALRVLQAAYRHGAAFPAVTSPDPIYQVEGRRVVRDFSDSTTVLAQSPQAFSCSLLARASLAAGNGGLAIDDEAQLVAALGHDVIAVAGEPWNIKLLDTDDVAWLETLVDDAKPL